MADMKTSQFPAASTLTGSEIFGIVQNGIDVKTTLSLISQYSPNLNLPSVKIGENSYVSPSNQKIAIGYNASASGSYSIALGNNSNTSFSSDGGIAIGSHSEVNDIGSIAIGNETNSSYAFGISIGNQSSALGAAISIGAGTSSDQYGISIGYNTKGGSLDISIGFKTYSNNNASLAIGTRSKAYGEFAVSIGAYSQAIANDAISIGAYCASSQLGSITVGLASYAGGIGSIAIGRNVHISNGNEYSIAIGEGASTYNNKSISMGYHSIANGLSSVAIGNLCIAKSNYSIAIGGRSYAFGKSISIGYKATNYVQDLGMTACIAIGYSAKALTNKSSVIGAYAKIDANSTSATIIGSYSYAKNSIFGTMIGHDSYSSVKYGTAIGTYTIVTGIGALAIGVGCGANAGYSMAFGMSAIANYDYSIVFGAYAQDRTSGSFVVTGYPVENLKPTETWLKLSAQSSATTEASYIFDIGGATVTISYNTAGTIGNGAIFQIINNGTPNQTPFVDYFNGSNKYIYFYLQTDSNGNPSNNTLETFSVDPVLTGFSYTYTGGSGSSTPITQGYGPFTLTGGMTGTGPVVLCSDGSNNPSQTNTPSMIDDTIGNISGTVIAYETSLWSDTGDTASFVLSPILCYRDSNLNYTFVGTPTFTMQNNTSGAANWSVPTMSISGSNSQSLLEITCSDQGVSNIDWVAFLKLETNR